MLKRKNNTGYYKMNKKGQSFDIMINLLIIFMAVTFLIALIPGFTSVIDSGLSNASGLNCQGVPDYNSTIGEKSSIGCLALKLYLPYIILGVLVVLIAKLFHNRSSQPVPGYG